MRGTLSLTLRVSVSILALACCSATVQAQTASSSGSSANGGSTLETVVVTAERRTENLMTTPISADVVSGSDLQTRSVVTVDDLQFLAPSVTVDDFGQGIDFDIRGIGKGAHNTQTETGVITYRDGVATFAGYMTEEPYYDIANVQVLRGPQGTFVGEDAIGGAVFVNSNDPKIGGDYDGYAQASYGNYSDTQLEGAVNIPVSDTFALRIAGFGEARGSFYSVTDTDPADNCPGGKYAGCKVPQSVTNTPESFNPGDRLWASPRVSALWKPTDALTVSLKVNVDYLDSGAWRASPGSAAKPTYDSLFRLSDNSPAEALDRMTRAVLKVDYVLPDGITLQSVSGYQKGNTNWTSNLLGQQINGFGAYTFWAHVSETIQSQEINIISPDTGRFTWVAGAYAKADLYDWEKPWQFIVGVPAGTSNVPPGNATNYEIEGSTPYASWAAFGQASYKLSDQWQIQLGGRWSSDRVHNDVPIWQYGTYFVANQMAQSYSFDYKAALNWTVSDTQFLYAFAATGYKPGGLNLPTAATGGGANPIAFSPERDMNYEAGWKARWFDGHLLSQIDGYYNSYKNFIITAGNPLNPFTGAEINVTNPTKIYGLEAEEQAMFGDFSFSTGIGLLNSQLGEALLADSRVAGPAVELKDRPISYAPNFSLNASTQYVFHIGGGDTLVPRVNFVHLSHQWATVFQNVAYGDYLAPRNLLGAQLEWDHGTYSVILYGTNLLQDIYVSNQFSTPGLDFAGAPRQFGIRLAKAF
ncbi:MAG TPA: TonB-dependent receptor [Rhizomicrobium sp.]|nr:TonB-dependent receptor [Rhizomicrobium sp.]